MLVCFEGPDGVGKSTCIENILSVNKNIEFLVDFPFCKKYKKPTKKLEKHLLELEKIYNNKPMNNLKFQLKCMEIFKFFNSILNKAKNNKKKIFLIDRYYYSTLIYGLIYETGKSNDEWKKIIYNLKKEIVIPNKTIILMDNKENILNRNKKRNSNDEFDNKLEENLQKMLFYYNTILDKEIEYFTVTKLTEIELTVKLNLIISKLLF